MQTRVAGRKLQDNSNSFANSVLSCSLLQQPFQASNCTSLYDHLQSREGWQIGNAGYSCQQGESSTVHMAGCSRNSFSVKSSEKVKCRDVAPEQVLRVC